MILRHLAPELRLAPFIDKLWYFESSIGVPQADNRVIAPNGKAKIIYSYVNKLGTIDRGIKTSFPSEEVYFIGVWDRPVVLYSEERATATIGIELSPQGVHRFLPFSLQEILNRVVGFSDLYGSSAKELASRLEELTDPMHKVKCLQDFLIKLIETNNRHQLLIDHTVQLIKSTNGLIEIKELERKTGYSKRYLDLLFQDHIGISPKTLASITRFQSFYNAWANNENGNFYQDSVYDAYYDQAHFIKEFKRFTGHTPLQYTRQKNEFGKIFYKDQRR